MIKPLLVGGDWNMNGLFFSIINGGFNGKIICKHVEDNDLVSLEHEFHDFPFSWECHDPN